MTSSSPEDYQAFSSFTANDITEHSKPKNSMQESFPVKLHRIVERAEIDRYSHIISWCQHGRSFKIHNQTLFFNFIAVRNFFSTSWASFRRDLGKYGFRQIKGVDNPDKGAYFHELFLRGRVELCLGMIRFKGYAPSQNDPDFSLMEGMPETNVSTDIRGILHPILSTSHSRQFKESKTKMIVVDSKQEDIKEAEIKVSIDLHSLSRSGDYLDFARVPDQNLALAIQENRPELFPVKLHRILQKKEYESIISWQTHGRAFKIHNENLFLQQIICRYFYMREFKSFVKQLSTYGFQRIVKRDNEDKGCYFHQLFLRGRERLSHAITNSKRCNLVDPSNEPRFSSYEPLPLSGSLVELSPVIQCDYNSEKVKFEEEKSKQEETEGVAFTLITMAETEKKLSTAAALVLLSSPNKYRDYSKITDEEALVGVKRSHHTQLFPSKLHQILERSVELGYSNVISWCEHGRAFKIYDEQMFLERVISTTFYMRELKSFFRQLGVYGFRKIANENNKDKGCYYHEMFLRNRPGLCLGIAKQKTSKLIDMNIAPYFDIYGPVP